MRINRIEPGGLSLAYLSGAGSLFIAALLLLIHWRLSVVVLSIYGLWCAMAPFIPALGFFAPVISRGRSGRKVVALTFDDGPDPMATPALLRLLQRHGLSVTFFVSGHRVAQYPGLIESILNHGHSIGNHSYRHDPLVFFKGARAIRREIESTQSALIRHGVVPRLYRPPVGVVGPGLRKPLCKAGLRAVNFSCRAFDRGNKRIKGIADRIMECVQADDIILLHDIMPKGERFCRLWLTEIDQILTGLKRRGLMVAPLQELIGQPVMDKVEGRRMMERTGGNGFQRT